MNKPETPRSSEPFVSMLSLQDEYLRLSAQAEALECEASRAGDRNAEAVLQELVLLRRGIRQFERRAAMTGAILDESADRSLAQSMLDYWGLRQVYLSRLSQQVRELVHSDRGSRLLAAAPRLRDPMSLVPFDETLAPELPDEPSPFVGLNAFGQNEADKAIFYGREEAISELVAMLAERQLIIVAGPSGSGKSSLVMAGLVPALRRGAVEGSTKWTYWPAVLPGADPFATLLQTVRPSCRDAASWIAEHRAAVEKAPDGLAGLLSAAGAPDRPSLLIIDQVEELLSMVQDAETRATFAAAIVALLRTAAPKHRVVVIVREDFLDRLLALESFASLPEANVIEFRPKPMTSAELRLAIEEPARSIGLKFDEGIVEDLVREVVNDPAALPLLQFTLTQLWRQRRRNRITRAAYGDVGRPAEALGRTAERVYESLNSPENQTAAKDIFLALVVPSIGAEFVRRRVRRETLHALRDAGRIDRVLIAFVEAGLIRKIEGVEAADDRFDVMHEALLRNWQRLTGWLEEKLRTCGRQLQARDRARLWEESGRAPDHLAIGSQIGDAELFAPDDALIRDHFEASRKFARNRTRLGRALIAIAGLVLIGILGVAVMGYLQNGWRADLIAQERKANRDTAKAGRLLAEAHGELHSARHELASMRTQYDEVIAAGTPSLARNLSLPSTSTRGPGITGFVWVGNRQGSLIGSPRDLSEVLPTLITPGEPYRLRGNLALRSALPDQAHYRRAAQQFGDGTVAAGSLIVALAPPAGYDRQSLTQYWLRILVVPRVIVRYPAGIGDENRAAIGRIVQALRSAGYDAVAAEPIPALKIDSELRFFYRQDQSVANELSARLGALLDPEHSGARAVSGMDSPTRPDPGTLELWLDPSIRAEVTENAAP